MPMAGCTGRGRQLWLTGIDPVEWRRLLADLEERAAKDADLQEEREQTRQERDDTAVHNRSEAKQLVEELKQLVMAEGGQWHLHKTGAGAGS